MKDRIEIEKQENGYVVTVWKQEESEESDMGYMEPKKFVAKTRKEAMEIFNDNFEE